jgi:hypothetical protein
MLYSKACDRIFARACPVWRPKKTISGYLGAGGRFDAIGVSAWPMQSHGDHAALQARARNGRVTVYQKD